MTTTPTDEEELETILRGIGETAPMTAEVVRTLHAQLKEARESLRGTALEAARIVREKHDAIARAEAAERERDVYESDIQIAITLLEQAEPPREDEDQEWPCLVHSLVSAYRKED